MAGFSLLEVLVGAAILAVALLAMAAMFPTGYTNITEAGKMTMALTAGRQILEDISALPFDNINSLNNFDTLNPGSLPPGEPERTIARRWRYALAAEGSGFTFTATEKAEWSTLSTGQGVSLNGRGLISVNGLSATLIQVTVRIELYPGRSTGVRLVTNITRL
jgi:prepilin-type N-terminal cleavage/methylation domain-containing protein